MKKLILILISLCLVFALFAVPSIAIDSCLHKYQERVTLPTCTKDGYITCECEKCGDIYIKTAEECDHWSDWCSLNRAVAFHYDTGKNVNRSNIDVLYRRVLYDYFRRVLHEDTETAYKAYEAGFETYQMIIGDVKVCFEDIKEEKVSYELELIKQTDYGYYYKIRFNDCDLHSKGHRMITRCENVKRDDTGSVYYQEVITFCSVCGKEFGRTIDNTYYEEYPTELPEETTEPPYGDVLLAPLGDVDLDMKVTAADAREILRCAARLSNGILNRENADVNADGRITSADARLALRIAAKLEKA